MQFLTRVGIVFVLCLCAASAAGKPRHLLVGTWALDVSRISQQPAPKSVTFRLSEADQGAYVLTVDIEAPDGSRQHAGGSAFRPGEGPFVVEGSADVDLIMFTMPSRRILVMAGAYQGHPSHTRVFALSDDGREMTETIVGHIDGKTPHIRTNYWRRQ